LLQNGAVRRTGVTLAGGALQDTAEDDYPHRKKERQHDHRHHYTIIQARQGAVCIA